MPTTTNKGYSVPTTGTESGTWGSDLNTNTFAVIDLNIGGITTLTLSNANVTLTTGASGQIQSVILRLTGTLTGNVQITTSAVGFVFIENLTTGAFNVTFTNGVGTPVTLPQGVVSAVVFDATNGPYLVRPGYVITGTSGQVTVTNGSGGAGNPTIGLDTAPKAAVLAITEQAVTANGATLTVDMSLGWVLAVSLQASVTTVAFTNWPASGTEGRAVFEISNTGAFNITGWPATIWSGGTAPTITSGNGKKDTVIITSYDGGSTFRGYIAAQNMS